MIPKEEIDTPVVGLWIVACTGGWQKIVGGLGRMKVRSNTERKRSEQLAHLLKFVKDDRDCQLRLFKGDEWSFGRGYPMSWNEPFRNFLRRSVKDFVIAPLEEVLGIWRAGGSVAQKRPTSIQASHPMEIGSVRR